MTDRKSIAVVVVRRAFSDCPDMVLRPRLRETAEDAIRRHYPSAKFDGLSGFDTDDGGSFLYDDMLTTD